MDAGREALAMARWHALLRRWLAALPVCGWVGTAVELWATLDGRAGPSG